MKYTVHQCTHTSFEDGGRAKRIFVMQKKNITKYYLKKIMQGQFFHNCFPLIKQEHTNYIKASNCFAIDVQQKKLWVKKPF